MNSNSVCVDASLAVAWLFDEPYSENADTLRREWREHLEWRLRKSVLKKRASCGLL